MPIVQAGRPMEVYRHPVNMFVARFLGSPAMNLLPATVTAGRLTVGEQSVNLPVSYAAAALPDRVVLGIRPEDIVVRPTDAGGALQANVVTVAPLGAETQLTLALRGIADEITVRAARDSPFSPGDLATLDLDAASIRLFDAATERAVLVGGGATP